MSHEPFRAADTARERIRSRLKVRQLSLLVHLGRQQSLTRAADTLGITQPAVTKALNEIEALFGATLFVRNSRGLRPTALGEIAIVRAKRMLQELDHWAADLQAAQKGGSTRLFVGAVPYVSAALLSQSITRLGSHGVTVVVRRDTTDKLVQALSDHELDCVLGRATAIAGTIGLEHQVLYRQRPMLVGHERLVARLAHRSLNWPKLAELDWILPSPLTPIGTRMAELFIEEQVPHPVPIIETHSVDIMHGVISTNERAITLIPEVIASEMVQRGGVACFPWTLDWDLPPLSLIRRAREIPLQAEEAFVQILKDLCDDLS